MASIADPATKGAYAALSRVPAVGLLTAVYRRAVHARNARLAWIFGFGMPITACETAFGRRESSIVEVISSEDRFWDACPCAPLVVGYVTELLGVEATRWEFAKAIVRTGHVSTLFLGPAGSREPLELWVSATHEGPNGWRLRHSELPARTRA